MAVRGPGQVARPVVACSSQDPASLGRWYMGHSGRTRFAVKVHQGGSTGADCCTVVGSTHTPGPAFTKVCQVIQQWAASEGAITPGTTVSIVDTNDGGNLFVAQYLGYEVNLLGRDPKAWPGPKHKQSHPIRSWPK